MSEVLALVLLPGMVDLHAHLPQLPNAGLGAGLDLLTWLGRYIFPLERRWQDPELAGRLSAAALLHSRNPITQLFRFIRPAT